MTSKRYKPKDYEFTLRLLDNGCVLSHHSGVIIAFSAVEELCAALEDFQRTGQGLIGTHLRKCVREDGPKMSEFRETLHRLGVRRARNASVDVIPAGTAVVEKKEP